MKTIGIIGGLSWEATSIYYELLNKGVKAKLGGLHNPKIILHSISQHEIHELQYADKWNEAAKLMSIHAKQIQEAGADFILISSNTMHKVVPSVQKNLNIPIIHITQTTAEAIKAQNCKKSILLGTQFTMNENFNKKIYQNNGIEIVVPNEKEIIEIDNIIFKELAQGKILENSKRRYLEIIERLYMQDKTIDSVILGCTEIGLLIKKEDTKLKIFDTTSLHVNRALQLAL